ncbi:ankyrin repeat and LEM domain-containing protein 1-like [Euwallacea similis]|uniref:ankyrin repeat and LEM domain-containing protein 1-like n=1 Tax=Euwallacea similis TaxID=1736056 RepID=UPI00344CB17F
MLYRGKNKKEFYLASLLYDSIEYKHIESVLSLLTEKGADPNLVLPKKGISPFHLVIGCDSYEFARDVINVILQNGGNPNVRSDDGLTPIHIAAAWGRSEFLELLLKNGGDPEVGDVTRKTPFHYAAEEGFTDCLNLLKAYLPTKREFIRRDEDNNNCCLVLDKIIVNTGALIGEYYIAEDDPGLRSITTDHNSQHHLNLLPHTNTTEYIINWVSGQQSQNVTTNSDSSIAESITDGLGTQSSFECSDESLGESDDEREIKRFDPKLITFRKVYRKTRRKSSSPKNKSTSLDVSNSISKSLLNETFYSDARDFSSFKEYSKESGVVTIPNSSISTLSEKFIPNVSRKQDKSSDYFTCSHISINSLEKNIFELTDDLTTLSVNVQNDNAVKTGENSDDGASAEAECSFVSVSEVYKYIDAEEGVVLYERRFLKSSSGYAKSVKSSNVSCLSSLPPSFEYDDNNLRRELRQLGYNPGPITDTTKSLYLKKLHQLKKHPEIAKTYSTKANKKIYSVELEKCLRNLDWCTELSFKNLETQLEQQFSSPNPTVKWREGMTKSSFTYLLLDPRLTKNLPHRAETLSPLEIWQTFLSSIFYVGKGKRSRPYQHLYDAVGIWKKQETINNNQKLQKILDIWTSDSGVICLHVFMNIIPVEAYTREAAMISAITLSNLTNIKGGEFYGITATWPQRQKKMLGVYLLHKAMMIFLHEGERQLYPTDIN